MTNWRGLIRWIGERLGPSREEPARAGRVSGGESLRRASFEAPQPDRTPAKRVRGDQVKACDDPSKAGKVEAQVGPRATPPAGGAGAGGAKAGARTQFARDAADETDLVMGVDFGTLSTRVIVRSPYVANGRAVPVRWSVDRGVSPYFLPAVLRGGTNGELALASGWDGPEDGNLKTDLMDRPADPSVRASAAAYLALALREARDYVLSTQAGEYGWYRLRWHVHLGIPSAGYDDQRVRAAFLCVARAAWSLSRRSEAPTAVTAMAALEGAADGNDIDADPDVAGIDVYPEIAALVVGYARSRRRRDGLHVMVDVGASTVDVCGFGLQDQDGDDQYLLNTALVKRFGIRELHRRRVDAIKDANPTDLSGVRSSLDPFSEVPFAGGDYLAAPMGPLRARLDEVDGRYVDDLTHALMTVLMDLRRWRDPNAEAWTTGLPLFRVGGGAEHGLVVRAVREAHHRLMKWTDTNGIDEQNLPTLETLEVAEGLAVDATTQHRSGVDRAPQQRAASQSVEARHLDDVARRLGVAYGLSFDRFDIGDIVPPHEIDDVPPMPPRRPAEYVSKDRV